MHCPVLMSQTEQVSLKKEKVSHLEWQLPSQWNSPHSPLIRFMAQTDQSQKSSCLQKSLQEGHSFSGEMTVTGRVGQRFMVCAKQVSFDGFMQVSMVADTDDETADSRSSGGRSVGYAADGDATASIYLLTLLATDGRLTVTQSQPCPEYLESQYPFVSRQHIRSSMPFLEVHQQKDRGQEKQKPLVQV